MMPSSSSRLLCLALAIGLTGSLACAGSGSKDSEGRPKRTVLMTEYDDARVGAEASKAVAAQMGEMENEELSAYVTEIGRRLLRGLPRRSFEYRFAVVDQVEPNAFALPGGYIFISRGLLALANSEDELACVIGHEITHAAHRHAAAQQALGKRGVPIAAPWMRAAKQAGYSREMERDADKGGQILCAAAGYDPMGMSTFLASLGQTERLRLGFSRNPSFFDTHPGSTERAAINRVRANEMRWRRNPELGDTVESLFAVTDGLPIGQRPESGVFVGDRFLHPVLDFQLRFPAGWDKVNTNEAVGATAPRGQAVVFLSGDGNPGTPAQAANAWLEEANEDGRISVKKSQPVKVGRFEAWRLQIEASTGGGTLASHVTFIPYRDANWRITGVARASEADKTWGRTLSTARSFRQLTDEERSSIRYPRLRFTTAGAGETIAQVTQRSGSAWDVNEAAVFNGVFANHRYEGGEQVKIASIEAYVPPPR